MADPVFVLLPCRDTRQAAGIVLCALGQLEHRTGSIMRTSSDVLPLEAASRLAEYRSLVRQALPGVERMILFGSRARGLSHEDSDYDVAVLFRDLSDTRSVRRILSDLAYDHVLSGFFIRPIPLPSLYLDPADGHATELAEDIARDGVEVG